MGGCAPYFSNLGQHFQVNEDVAVSNRAAGNEKCYPFFIIEVSVRHSKGYSWYIYIYVYIYNPGHSTAFHAMLPRSKPGIVASGCWVQLQTLKSENLNRNAPFQRKKIYEIRRISHLANGPWNKSLNFIFPTRYVIPKRLKFSHWPSKIS